MPDPSAEDAFTENGFQTFVPMPEPTNYSLRSDLPWFRSRTTIDFSTSSTCDCLNDRLPCVTGDEPPALDVRDAVRIKDNPRMGRELTDPTSQHASGDHPGQTFLRKADFPIIDLRIA